MSYNDRRVRNAELERICRCSAVSLVEVTFEAGEAFWVCPACSKHNVEDADDSELPP
jgi:hypothetical protein